MLPNPNGRPSSRRECLVNFSVPLDVPSELGPPVALVSFRLIAVIRATVPVAAIEQNQHAPPWEGDVGPERSSAIEINCVVAAEPQPGSVEGRPQGNLRLGITFAVSLHHRCYRRRAGRRVQLAGRTRESLLASAAFSCHFHCLTHSQNDQLPGGPRCRRDPRPQ